MGVRRPHCKNYRVPFQPGSTASRVQEPLNGTGPLSNRVRRLWVGKVSPGRLPVEADPKKGWEGKQCGSTKVTWGKRWEGGEQDDHSTLALQPPKAAIFTFVMISKWGYVDSHRATPAVLKGVSLTALNWSLICLHRRECTIHSSEEQQRLSGSYRVPSTALEAAATAGNKTGDKKPAVWSLSYIHSFLSLEMIL